MSPDESVLVDMVVAGRNIATFVAGLTWEEFEDDLKTQSAMQHQLIVIGEAAKRLSLDFRAHHEAIEWREVAGLRDVPPTRITVCRSCECGKYLSKMSLACSLTWSHL